MLSLSCTVRGCGEALSPSDARLTCARGHAFDRAREGYWNLLQPQDRKSKQPGDRDDAVAARRRWLARGFTAGLSGRVRAIIDRLALSANAAAIDVGCGEGTFTAQLLIGSDLAVAGIDLSAKAVGLAARAFPQWTWIVANADRGLPFTAGSVALALSIFGRRPAAELSRVLAPAGTLIVVVPGADDLIELREASYGDGLERDRTAAATAELAAFTLVDRSDWTHRVRHDRAALSDALAMSYRGARAREQERLAGLTGLDVTLSAAILTLVPSHPLR